MGNLKFLNLNMIPDQAAPAAPTQMPDLTNDLVVLILSASSKPNLLWVDAAFPTNASVQDIIKS